MGFDALVDHKERGCRNASAWKMSSPQFSESAFRSAPQTILDQHNRWADPDTSFNDLDLHLVTRKI